MSINSCKLILAGYQSIYCENGPEVCASSACPGDAMFAKCSSELSMFAY